MPKVTITFELDEVAERLFLQSVVERVISTSMAIVERSTHDDSEINIEDWLEWRPIVVTFWAAVHDEVYRYKRKMSSSNRVYLLRKGDIL